MASARQKAAPDDGSQTPPSTFFTSELCTQFRTGAETVAHEQLDDEVDFSPLYEVLQGTDIESVDLEGIAEQTFLSGHARLLVPAYFAEFSDEDAREDIPRALLLYTGKYGFRAAFDAISHQLFFGEDLDGAKSVAHRLEDSRVHRRLSRGGNNLTVRFLEQIVSCTSDPDAIVAGIDIIGSRVSNKMLTRIGEVADQIADLTDGDEYTTDEVSPFLRLVNDTWSGDDGVTELLQKTEGLFLDPGKQDWSLLQQLKEAYWDSYYHFERSGALDILVAAAPESRAAVAEALGKKPIAYFMMHSGSESRELMGKIVHDDGLRSTAPQVAKVLEMYKDRHKISRPIRLSLSGLVQDIVDSGEEGRRLEITRAARFLTDIEPILSYKGVAREQLGYTIGAVARTYGSRAPRIGKRAQAHLEKLMEERAGSVLRGSLVALKKTAEAGVSYEAFDAVARLVMTYKGGVSEQITKHIGENIEGMADEDVIHGCECLMRGKRAARRGRECGPPYGAIRESLERYFPSETD